MATFGRRDGSYAVLEAHIPEIQDWDYEVTSDETPAYNCIAFAAGDEERCWWPLDDESVYWPDGAPLECTVSAFIAAYATVGYVLCEGDSYEPGHEKVVIYVDDEGRPQHAAIQVDDLYWKSKCGQLYDIKHPLRALEGRTYGRPAVFLRRLRGDQR